MLNVSSIHNVNATRVYSLRCFYLKWEFFLYGAHEIILIAITIVIAAMVIPIIFMNGVAISVFSKRRQLKTSSNILFLSTSIADFFTGLITIPFAIYILVAIVFYQDINCYAYATLTFAMEVFVWISLLTTLVIACDRYFAIFRPYLYHEKILGRRKPYTVTVLGIWIFILLVVSASFLVKGFIPAISLNILLPFILTFSVYVHVRIYLTVKGIHKKDRTSVVSVSADQTGSVRSNRTERSRQAKITRLTACMLISLFSCYIPRVVVYAAWYYEIGVYGTYTPYLDTFGLVAHVATTTRSLVNPILYYQSMEVLRQGVRNSVTSIANAAYVVGSHTELEVRASYTSESIH